MAGTPQFAKGGLCAAPAKTINCTVEIQINNTPAYTIYFQYLAVRLVNMPRDEVDSSLIVNGPRKRKLAPYATNEDNGSADMNEIVKWMKKSTGLIESQTSVEQLDDSDEGTHPRRTTGSLGSRNLPGGTRDGSKSQSRSQQLAVCQW